MRELGDEVALCLIDSHDERGIVRGLKAGDGIRLTGGIRLRADDVIQIG